MPTCFESFAHEHFVIWSEEKIVTQASNTFLLVGKWENVRGQNSRCPWEISFLKGLPCGWVWFKQLVQLPCGRVKRPLWGRGRGGVAFPRVSQPLRGGSTRGYKRRNPPGVLWLSWTLLAEVSLLADMVGRLCVLTELMDLSSSWGGDSSGVLWLGWVDEVVEW